VRGPSKRILIINGNPDPAPERLSSALADAYGDGAVRSGHDVRRIDVGSVSFSILRRAAAFTTMPQDPDIVAAQANFLWAEHLFFIFPLWLGGPPSLMKAFMEALACGSFLIGEGKHFPTAMLKGRSARIVVTMGMPSLAYRLLFGAYGVKAFRKSILSIAGVSPIRTTLLGGIGNSTARAARLLARLRRLGTQAS
jgi:putative NADPH-quinone reductase